MKGWKEEVILYLESGEPGREVLGTRAGQAAAGKSLRVSGDMCRLAHLHRAEKVTSYLVSCDRTKQMNQGGGGLKLLNLDDEISARQPSVAPDAIWSLQSYPKPEEQDSWTATQSSGDMIE